MYPKCQSHALIINVIRGPSCCKGIVDKSNIKFTTQNFKSI